MPSNAATWIAKRRAARRAARECIQCGAALAPDDITRCEWCCERARAAHCKNRRKRRAQTNASNKRRRARYLAEGRCAQCGEMNPRAPMWMCEPCGARQQLRKKIGFNRNPRRWQTQVEYEKKWNRRARRERRAAGLCTRCGKEPKSPDGVVGAACREIERQRHYARKIRDGIKECA